MALLWGILYFFVVIAVLVFLLLSSFNWLGFGKKSWAYNWNFGKTLLPKASATIQKIIGFLFWELIYLLVGVFISMETKPHLYQDVAIMTILGIFVITITSLTRRS